MSERGKRVFRFLLDPERDADVIGRMEAQRSMTGYMRKLVRRDIHDERLDFAALKASELQAKNAKLRELCADLYAEMITYSDAPSYNASVWAPKLRELGIEVDG